MASLTKQQLKARLRRAKFERRYTAQWHIWNALRWLGLKDIAYALFERSDAYHDYVNGHLVGKAQIVRNQIVVVAMVKRKPANEIADPPMVPSSDQHATAQ